jgi:hypothetical protein
LRLLVVALVVQLVLLVAFIVLAATDFALFR